MILRQKYGVHAIPEMWLINQRGEVASTDISVEELEQKIEQLLSLSRPSPQIVSPISGRERSTRRITSAGIKFYD